MDTLDLAKAVEEAMVEVSSAKAKLHSAKAALLQHLDASPAPYTSSPCTTTPLIMHHPVVVGGAKCEGPELTAEQQECLRAVKAGLSRSSSVANARRWSKIAARAHLLSLEKAGLVRREGKRGGTRWFAI